MKQSTLPWVLCTLALLLYSMTINGQQAKEASFKLLDPDHKIPITGATYQYGDQTGTSSEEGEIKFSWLQEETMKLSHISYGIWQLNNDQLKEATANGFFYRSEETTNLDPVTVISLRPRAGEREVLDINYKDRLAHDGGALLNDSPTVNSIRKSGNYGFDPVLRGFKYDDQRCSICKSSLS